jgi:2-iminobutanoate/2-iminopropanoate deaminase
MPIPRKAVISTKLVPRAIGPYSAGIKTDFFVYTAGQLGIIPETGNLIEGGIEAETRQSLQNVQKILEAAGTNLDRVVKTTVFLRDMNDFARMNSIYAEFFTENPPALTTVQVAALPKGAAVEIEAIALLADE